MTLTVRHHKQGLPCSLLPAIVRKQLKNLECAMLVSQTKLFQSNTSMSKFKITAAESTFKLKQGDDLKQIQKTN
jgi:hypothetical protein